MRIPAIETADPEAPDFFGRLRSRLWALLAFTRIPGNAFSFWIRETLHWSRGTPALPHEAKDGLFDYLGPDAPAAEAKARDFEGRFDLGPLKGASTRALYRKNLYLIDILEKAAAGLRLPGEETGELLRPRRCLDVGAQDWHYVFGLERWLRHGLGAPGAGRAVELGGIELDGYGIYPDFHSRRDYALAYAARTGNPAVTYEVGDFLRGRGEGYDIVTFFYPFVTRYQLLLWGLPLRFYRPEAFVEKAAAITRPGGWLMAFAHSTREHDLFTALARASGAFDLVREGFARSNLVDFHEEVDDRRFSIWRRRDQLIGWFGPHPMERS
jgi:hypothetical protein